MMLVGSLPVGCLESVPLGGGGGAPPVNPALSWTNLVLVLDWDSASVLTDVDGVYEWGDDSGVGNDFTQATGSKKPALSSGILADGIDDVMVGPALSAFIPGTTYTFVTAVNVNSIGTDASTPNNEAPWGTNGVWWALYGRSSNKFGIGHYNGGYISLEQSVVDVTGVHIIGVRWGAGTVYLRVDANAWTSVAMAVPGALTDKMWFAMNAANQFDGRALHAVWSTDLQTEASVDAVFNYYNAIVGAY